MSEIAAARSIPAHHTADFIIVVVMLVFSAVVGFRQELQAANAVDALIEQLAKMKAIVTRLPSFCCIPPFPLVN